MAEDPYRTPATLDGKPADSWKATRVWAIRLCALLYLLGVWLEGVGWGGPIRSVVPHWIGFFTQCAALFPRAARYAIEYRAEGYVCDTGEWHELDTRPYFPIDVNDKESRFQRVMFFYRRQKTVINELDRFLVNVHNRTPLEDGIPREEKIGGVRLMSIRGPIPEIGAPLVRVHYVPLGEIPEKERKQWYQTKSARITERCFGTRPKSVREKGSPQKEDDESVDPHMTDDPSMSADPSSDPRSKEEQP